MADKNPEEEYFHRLEQERIEKRRQQAAALRDAGADKAARQAAIGRCPKDGAKLEKMTYVKIELDRCPDCQGIWLDHGEGRAILEAEKKAGKGFFTDFINSVAGGKKEQSPL